MTPEPEPTPRDWWKSAVVYQVYPRSFADSDGDGIGDIPGIRQRLDHLERLGVDVVWLSPIYRSPMDDNGYDISDYQDVDPLVRDARGPRRPDRGSPRPWHEAGHGPRGQPHEQRAPVVPGVAVEPGRPEARLVLVAAAPPRATPAVSPGAEPTNWGSAFSEAAWTYDPGTDEYYLHIFAASQPELNWENPEVRQAVYSMMNWWLDRGVDGFRMDVINLISKVVHDDPPDLRDGVVGGPDRQAGPIDTVRFGDPGPYVAQRSPGARVPAGDAPGGLRPPAGGPAHRRRDARHHGGAGAALHRPGPGRARHGVPVRARRPRLGAGRQVGPRPHDVRRPRWRRWRAGRRGWATWAGTASTSATTTSPAA